jgi:hypothetical protein
LDPRLTPPPGADQVGGFHGADLAAVLLGPPRAPRWPAHRVIELAPLHWKATVNATMAGRSFRPIRTARSRCSTDGIAPGTSRARSPELDTAGSRRAVLPARSYRLAAVEARSRPTTSHSIATPVARQGAMSRASQPATHCHPSRASVAPVSRRRRVSRTWPDSARRCSRPGPLAASSRSTSPPLGHQQPHIQLQHDRRVIRLFTLVVLDPELHVFLFRIRVLHADQPHP